MMERVLKLMTLKNVIKTLSIVLIFIILTGCGNKLSITISDNKRDFKVIEKTDYIELNYKDKIYNLHNYEGKTKEIVLIPGCSMDEDYLSVTLLTESNLYFIMIDDEDLENASDLNFTWISESKNIKNLDYTKDIEQTSDKYLYCFRNVQINYINGSKKSILMSYDSSTIKKYDLVNFN